MPRLFLLLVCLIVLWIVLEILVRKVRRAALRGSGLWLRWLGESLGVPRPGSRQDPGAEELVRCARCGVYVPVSRAVGWRGERFCSDACRRAATRSAS